MEDPFINTPVARDHPAGNAADVVPSDTVELAAMTRFIRVGSTAGDLVVVTRGGQTVTIPNVQIGEMIPVEVKQIMATGTTATGITAFW